MSENQQRAVLSREAQRYAEQILDEAMVRAGSSRELSRPSSELVMSTLFADDMEDLLAEDVRTREREIELIGGGGGGGGGGGSDYGSSSAEKKLPLPPRYLQPTFASALMPISTNYGEGERVRNSFLSGSFWSLKKLPSKLEAGEVNTIRREHTSTNLLKKKKKAVKANGQGAWGGPLDIPIPYYGTPMDRADDIKRENTEQEKLRIDSFSRKPFSVPGGINQHPAANFIYPDFGQGGAIPPDLLCRKDVTDTFIFGPFSKCVPAGKPLEVSHGEAKKWVKMLYQQLAEDWASLTFSVRLTMQVVCLHIYLFAHFTSHANITYIIYILSHTHTHTNFVTLACNI